MTEVISEIIVYVSSPYTISGSTLHCALFFPLHRMWPRAWTVTSIVIIVIVISITVECVLDFILTDYIVVDAMIVAFETLLVIGCNKETSIKNSTCQMRKISSNVMYYV